MTETLKFCIVILMVALGVAIVARGARGHEFFDWRCCNELDCSYYRGEVKITPQGFYLPEFDMTIPYGPQQHLRPRDYGNMDARYDGARYDMPGDAEFDYALCELPKGTVRCFYAKMGGM